MKGGKSRGEKGHKYSIPSQILAEHQALHLQGNLFNKNSLRWACLEILKALGLRMSALKIQKWLEMLLCVNLYLSFKPRKKNKCMPVGQNSEAWDFFSPLPPTCMKFLLWIVIGGSDDKNYSGVAKKNTHGAFCFPCAQPELSDQPSGLKCNTVNRNTSSFLWYRRAVGCNSHYSKAGIFH